MSTIKFVTKTGQFTFPRPTPLISIQTENEFKESGKIKKTSKILTLKGKILSEDKAAGDSPITNENARLGILQKKISDLEKLISQDTGKVNTNITDVYIVTDGQSPTNISVLSGFIKLKTKSFQIDAGNTFADYTISIEAITDTQEFDESWSLDPSDEYDRFVKITRTRSITLQATDTESSYADAIAKIPVTDSPSGYSSYLTGVMSGGNYNKITSYSVNVEKNSVECSESWTVSSASALVDETYTIRESSESVFKSASKQISIRGLEGTSTSKYQNALTKFNSINKNWKAGDKESIGGISANIRSVTVGKNEVAGTVSVSIEISEGIEKAGEIFRNVSITDNPPTDHYVAIQAVGKPDGPILQKFGTTRQGTKSVNVDVIYQDGAYREPVVTDYMPSGSESFVDKDEIFFDERTGKITRNVSWTYGGGSGGASNITSASSSQRQSAPPTSSQTLG